ncbi:DNA repair protein RecN [Sphingomonas lacunae]|uniref:DNA repair protein RecN n=1 Tax=Sphingomonas lacunae TaxID=2698828 RepID=A0A6M4AWH5_9SPHN|nr:DNA repair protein RecN [Sphingomonas lacunae]QJQ33405.1 DNA repair protein RecN [Sphingomonas lacunae]
MLTALSIRDVVLIEALDLDFNDGLGVLTGETGAGKSILLDALGLALGSRADSGLVRHGTDRARVTASFAPLKAGHAALDLLDEAGIEVEPGEPLVIRREVKRDGGSRGFIADQPASAALLRDVGATLVEIHGQHDERGLLNPRGHRALLDAFGQIDLSSVAQSHGEWRAAETALAEARERLLNDVSEREWLDHSIAEIAALAPEAGEEEALAAARSDMQKGARLVDEMDGVDKLLAGSDGALAQLRAATRRLDRLAAEHPLFAEALAAFDRALIEAGEGEDSLSKAAEALRFDPAELDRIETRLFDLRALARKHRVEADGLAALLEDLTARRAAIDAGEQSLADLESRVARSQSAYRNAAEALHAARVKAAAALDKAVASELAPLKLDAAQFRTAVEPLDQSQWGPHGADRVEFLIATNPGAPFAGLMKIASGGELSRFLLALKVSLAEVGGAGTIIFDEIDRGVGGAVASAIGERLSRLSDSRQLLVVTHSPQVAARGTQHYMIAKTSDGTVARTGVRSLDAGERQEEIARMLSGADITDEARAQAARLMEVV